MLPRGPGRPLPVAACSVSVTLRFPDGQSAATLRARVAQSGATRAPAAGRHRRRDNLGRKGAAQPPRRPGSLRKPQDAAPPRGRPLTGVVWPAVRPGCRSPLACAETPFWGLLVVGPTASLAPGPPGLTFGPHSCTRTCSPPAFCVGRAAAASAPRMSVWGSLIVARGSCRIGPPPSSARAHCQAREPGACRSRATRNGCVEPLLPSSWIGNSKVVCLPYRGILVSPPGPPSCCEAPSGTKWGHRHLSRSPLGRFQSRNHFFKL